MDGGNDCTRPSTQECPRDEIFLPQEADSSSLLLLIHSFIHSLNQQAPIMCQALLVSVNREANRRDKTPCPQDAPTLVGPRRLVDDLLSRPGFPEELLWILSHREFSVLNEKMDGLRKSCQAPLCTASNPTNHVSTPAGLPAPPCSRQASTAPPPPTPFLRG